MWRIRQPERAPFVEITKVEESGHGKILSNEFVAWREQLAMKNIMDKLV